MIGVWTRSLSPITTHHKISRKEAAGISPLTVNSPLLGPLILG